MNLALLQLMAKNSAQDKNIQAMYHAYLDKKWGKLAANASDHSKPDFKSEYDRRQFTIAMENIDYFYHSGAFLDESTTTSTNVATIGVPKILPAMLRKIMPDLFIRDLVNISAIPVPEAKVLYYTAYKLSGTDKVQIGQKSSFNRAFANNTEGSDTVKRVTFDLASTNVSAYSKKLAAEWTVELMQDAMAYFNMSVEPLALKAKSIEIGLELDSDILEGILASATGGDTEWSATAPVGDVTTEQKKAYAATLYDAIITAANKIYKKCYTYPNWIVAGVDAVERLEKLENFKLDPLAANPTVQRQYVGVLNGKFKVYKDPFFTADNKMLLGFKDSNIELYAGFMFCPYVPLYLTGTVENPTVFKFAKGMMTRNAMKMLNGDMFGTVTITA